MTRNENRQEQIKERLHQAGYKYTRPRQQVAEILIEHSTHLTAPEIVDMVADRDESIGRMSVYRTLDLFTRLGFVRPSFQDGANAHYIVVLDGHHHHLVCQGCGRVIHFDEFSCPVAALEQEIAETFGFEVEGHVLEFYGRCEECRK